MKTVTIKPQKKEEFSKNFRIRILYVALYDNNVSISQIERHIENAGFNKHDNRFYYNKGYSCFLYINEKTICFCFDEVQYNSEIRISIVADFLKKATEILNNKLAVIQISYINRFVIHDFEDSEKERQSVLKYFFHPDFATEEELFYKSEVNLIALSTVTFNNAENGNTNIDFTITSSAFLQSFQEDIAILISNLEKLQYDYWRSAISPHVLKEMRKNSNEKTI